MLRRAAAVGLIFAAIFVGVDAGLSFWAPCVEKEPISEAKQQTNSAEKYCHSSLVVAGVRSFYITVKSEHEFVVAGSSVVIALFTIILAWSTIKLWGAGDEQIKIAARAAAAAEKANQLSREIFTTGERPWMNLAAITPVGPWKVLEDGASLKVKFIMTNIGKSPAMGPFVRARIVPLSVGPKKIAEIQRKILMQAFERPIDFEIPQPADAVPLHSPALMLDLKREEFDPGEAFLAAIIGVIDYRFIFDWSRHATPFCLAGVQVPTAKGEHAARLGGLISVPTGIRAF
jgi:hypothetical protein